MDGPAWISASYENAAVEFSVGAQVPQTPTSATVRFLDNEGCPQASFDGVIEHAGAGKIGVALDVNINGKAALSLRSPDDPDQPAGLH